MDARASPLVAIHSGLLPWELEPPTDLSPRTPHALATHESLQQPLWPSPQLTSPPPPVPYSSRPSNGHAPSSNGNIEVLGVLQGRLFKAEPSKSWTPLGTGDAELSIVQKKGEAFLTFFLTVGSNGVEVSRSTASSSDARFQPLALSLLCFLLS